MNNSNHRLIETTSIGSIALEKLSKDQDARVSGRTSKGIFIQTPAKWLVFLSFEKFKGPLTITLDKLDPILQLVSGGDPVRIASQSIFLPSLDTRIPIADSAVWQPPPPPAPRLAGSESHEKLVDFAKEIMSKKNGAGLGDLIPPLLGLPNTRPPLETINQIDWAYIQQLQNCIRNREAAPLARLLSTILGSGPGLTPSADDFIVGLLLALNRWQFPLWPAGSLTDLNHQIVDAAYEKTTTLSANLIECAALKLADERLINALDWIVTGVAREPQIIAHLLGWGNSSGAYTFTGMAATLTA
jgi:hypothetical protein